MKFKHGAIAFLCVMALEFVSLLWGAIPEAEAMEAAAQAVKTDALGKDSETKIVVNIASRGLYLLERGVKTRLFPVACGRPGTATPVGFFAVQEMVAKPAMTNGISGSAAKNFGGKRPLAYPWIGFSGSYGIFASKYESVMGRYVTDGSIAMREKDAADIYQRVSIGTPIEILYNRLVIEKNTDDVVAYYVYPDVYHRQPLTVSEVNKWLHGYGVDRFESDEAIAAKIKHSDGKPTYIARPFMIFINGKELKGWKGIEKEGIYFLPAFQMSDRLGISMTYDKQTGVLTSKYGKAPGVLFKSMVYVHADDAEGLFSIAGGRKGNTLSYRTTT